MTFTETFFTVMFAVLLAIALFEYKRGNRSSATFSATAANTMLITIVLIKLI